MKNLSLLVMKSKFKKSRNRFKNRLNSEPAEDRNFGEIDGHCDVVANLWVAEINIVAMYK